MRFLVILSAIGVVFLAGTAGAQNIHIMPYSQKEGSWRTHTVTVNNCDNRQQIVYDLANELTLSTALTLESGWATKPGLSVQVPGIGNANIGFELSQRYGVSSGYDETTRQNLRVIAPPMSNMKYQISIRETLARGTVLVEKGFGPFKKTRRSSYTFLTRRETRVVPQDVGCLYGKWSFVAWDERRPRRGLSMVYGVPQRRHIADGILTVNETGGVTWTFTLTNLAAGCSAVKLHCTGVLAPGSGSITTSHVTWDYAYPNQCGQVPAKYAEEFGYALCGRGLSHITGRTENSMFRVHQVVDQYARILQMVNSEGSFRWQPLR